VSIRSILCPVDFSLASEEALRYAVSLAAQVGAERVHVLHVHQPPRLSAVSGGAAVDASKRDAAHRLEDVTKRYSAHDVELFPHFVEGVPYEEIVREAQRLGVDLIVIGTHGRTGLAHMLLGSITEHVVRRSPIPVCTVRSRR
jgi:universal stress protein A